MPKAIVPITAAMQSFLKQVMLDFVGGAIHTKQLYLLATNSVYNEKFKINIHFLQKGMFS